MESPVAGDDGESDEDEGDDQPGVARGDQPANGERRPRRRGRRGGRRRRGNGPEDGLVGSITDELGPTSAPEATNAVADFDGGSYEPAPTLAQPEPAPQPAQYEPAATAYAPPEPVASAPAVSAPAVEETTQEADRAAARRRSTVREKVSFSAPADPAPAVVSHSAPEPVASPVPSEPAPADSSDAGAPRKAGWWSRRFGNGE
jgi:ribonuclease E